MAGMRCSLDVETFSSVDLSKCGVHKYVESPDFAILLLAYSFDDGSDEVTVIDFASGESIDNHPRLKDALLKGNPEGITFQAYNAAFERQALKAYFNKEMPPEQWRDTMILALELGLPRSLADVGIALGLPKEKLKDPQGKALINYFCKPCRPTKTNGGRTRNLPEHDPAKWELFKRYNRQDVVTEKAIWKKLSGFGVARSEWGLWQLDQRMNDNGVRLDVPMIKKIVDFDNERREELMEEARELTGLQNPNSLTQLKEWLIAQGAPLNSVTKETVSAALSLQYIPENVRRALEIRQALGKTSVAKYSAMLEAVNADGRLRGILQFYGANRSGRWSGKMVQTHNLARNTLPDLDLAREIVSEGDFDELETLFGEPSFIFSELVRTAFIPSEGCRFIVSDFSAIEARVISWISGEEWRLEAFRAGKDIYCESASQMYHVPVVKHGENGELRQKGKIAELALGYQGGVGAMKQMDKGGSIPEEEMQGIVDRWRMANPKVVKLWKTCEMAAKEAIEEERTVKIQHGIAFRYIRGNLFVGLPQGRHLCYWEARLEDDPRGWGTRLTYMGVDRNTKQWGKVETYGGKIVENIVQAVARDCLAEVIRKVSALGYKIVMHVHDEIIVDVPKEDTEAPAKITKIMGEPIEWAPGLPLKGETYETDFYRKD